MRSRLQGQQVPEPDQQSDGEYQADQSDQVNTLGRRGKLGKTVRHHHDQLKAT
jgi:hypothetical protein